MVYSCIQCKRKMRIKKKVRMRCYFSIKVYLAYLFTHKKQRIILIFFKFTFKFKSIHVSNFVNKWFIIIV